MDDIFADYVIDFAIGALASGERIALVTLVAIEGSAPRPIGAQMAVTENGAAVGYLSGGCIENSVIQEAIAVIKAGENRLVRYGEGSDYIDIRLPCGSAIILYFDMRIVAETLHAIHADYLARRVSFMRIAYGNLQAAEIANGSAVRKQEKGVIYRAYPPALRLVILGMGPVAVRLANIAAMSGLELILYSPDDATCKICADMNIAVHPIHNDEFLKECLIDKYTATIVIFHDHEWEEKLLPKLLAKIWEYGGFYIGAMGSHQSHQARIAMLQKKGIASELIAKIHAPAGLFPSGRFAGAIAISILAQIIRISQLECDYYRKDAGF